MLNIRGIFIFVLFVVIVVFGFIWYFGRKKSFKFKLLENKEINLSILILESFVFEKNNIEFLQNLNNGNGDGSLL